jgi:RNA polymerase sigma factor (sigma-70 family)
MPESMTLSDAPELERRGAGLFPQTMWSAIAGANQANEGEARAALERMARAYWQPLYVFVRQRGMIHEDAADAVQGFFMHLLSKDLLQGLEQRETRFRSFLLRCFQNWLTSAHRREQAQRRGGAAEVLPLAAVAEEIREPHQSPEEAFDRRWAQSVFDQARARLREELMARERPDYFQALEQRVFQPRLEGPNWAEVAAKFSLSEGAVRKAAADLRGRFALLLRQEVSEGVSEDAEVDEELRYLFQLLSQSSVSG